MPKTIITIFALGGIFILNIIPAVVKIINDFFNSK